MDGSPWLCCCSWMAGCEDAILRERWWVGGCGVECLVLAVEVVVMVVCGVLAACRNVSREWTAEHDTSRRIEGAAQQQRQSLRRWAQDMLNWHDSEARRHGGSRDE